MPDFTVIDGGGPEGRDRIYAEQELRDALQETAANMLGPADADDSKPRGHMIEHFADGLTDHMQFAAAAGARLQSGILKKVLATDRSWQSGRSYANGISWSITNE
jgi:hypothetical protein